MFWLTPDTYRTGSGDQNLSVGTDPLTANTYGYVNGDPINLVDPSGHGSADTAERYVTEQRAAGQNPHCWAAESGTIECTTVERQQEIVQVKAEQVAKDLEAGVLEVNSFGACGNITVVGVPTHIGLLVGGELELCEAYDGDVAALLGFVGGGAGGIYVGGSVGPLVSNAPSIEQILGASFCIGVNGGILGSASAEICFSLDDKENFTGYWTLFVGAGGGVGADVHVFGGTTFALHEWDVPCLEGPDLPNAPNLPKLPSIDPPGDWFDIEGPDLPDLGNLPKLPTVGCGPGE